MARLFMLLLGLWVGIFLVMLAMARLNNLPANMPQLLSESFYYTAIAFAVYHLITKHRRRRQEEEPATRSKPGAEEADSGTETDS